MPAFPAADGTTLAYRSYGSGDPVVCLPGGPMLASAYLGDLGGLPGMVALDLRGTGDSAVPDDPATYRCDRQVGDVEALRAHLGLDRMALLGHSAGANLAVLYALRHPGRVSRLLLVTPSTRVVGLEPTGEERLTAARAHADEPWFPDAYAALERATGGAPADGDWALIDPLFYGRWDDAARAHLTATNALRDDAAAAAYIADGAFDPAAARTALATLPTPTLVLAGEADPNTPPSVAAAYAALFASATLTVQPGAGHYPWLDDPAAFVATITGFLG